MRKEENLPPHVKFWLSPDTKHDCYFVVGPALGPNKKIGCFKSFLIGYSEPLRVMLCDSEIKEQGDISIVDIKPDTFTYFLKCLYMNGDNIIKDKLSSQECIDLLYVVDKYLVTYIKEKLVDYMVRVFRNAIPLDDIFTALSSPVFMNEKRLEYTLRKIIASKFKEIFSSPLILNISSDSLLWILKLDNVGKDEITYWEVLLKWAIKNTDSQDGSVLRQYMLKHLKFIRFCTMTSDEFCKKVVPTEILTHTEVYEICKSFGIGNSPNMEFICNNTIPRVECKKYPPESTYIFCVNNIEKVRGELKSPTFKLQGLEWSILFRKNCDYLSFFLCREGRNLKSVKSHSTTVELVLINHSGNNFSRQFTVVFNEPHFGYDEFCSSEEIMDLSKKYVFYNGITLLVCIE